MWFRKRNTISLSLSIIFLSQGGSVNDAIDPALCAVLCALFDRAVAWVRRYGRGSLMAKTDIVAAFRLLPVHLDNLHLLGCFRQGGYLDRCLTMGCAISCSLFEMFSTFLKKVFRDVLGLPFLTIWMTSW